MTQSKIYIWYERFNRDRGAVEIYFFSPNIGFTFQFFWCFMINLFINVYVLRRSNEIQIFDLLRRIRRTMYYIICNLTCFLFSMENLKRYFGAFHTMFKFCTHLFEDNAMFCSQFFCIYKDNARNTVCRKGHCQSIFRALSCLIVSYFLIHFSIQWRCNVTLSILLSEIAYATVWRIIFFLTIFLLWVSNELFKEYTANCDKHLSKK